MALPHEKPYRIYRLAGPTGSGKSDLIRSLQQQGFQALDLEELCRHDGSVFAPLRYGRQPTSYQFHRQLLACWSRFDVRKPIFLENELHRLGNLSLPDWLVRTMTDSDLILLDVNPAIRKDRLALLIAGANPVLFLECLQKLSFKLGTETLHRVRCLFSSEDFKGVAQVLMTYYDATPGYLFRPESIKFQVRIDHWVLPEIINTIFNKLEMSGSCQVVLQ